MELLDHPSRTWIGAAVGLVLLATPTLALFVLGVAGAVVHAGAPIVGVILLVPTFGVAVGVRYEWWFLRRADGLSRVRTSDAVRDAVSLLVGAVVTIAIVVESGTSPIVAAALVGVGAALVVPSRAVPAYCGAFVGMTSPALFVTYWHTVVAAVLASVVYVVSGPVFRDIGGKLGTTAFVAATATIAVTAGGFGSGTVPESLSIALAVGSAVVGAVATFVLHTRSSAEPVLASGVVGVSGGVLLPIVHVGDGGLLAAAAFSASFAGMSARRRIPNGWWMAVVGAVVGAVVVYTTPYLGGSGGKLGTIAFGACLAVHGSLRAVHLVRIRRRADERSRRDTT
ncbi:hypothetical protein [Halorubrum sp. DTA98]|uniref:hypothetical protein n=1 Tax=Halorubrum sp. DTA98 TaxID=3402163 RepID=UPI003AB05B61